MDLLSHLRENPTRLFTIATIVISSGDSQPTSKVIFNIFHILFLLLIRFPPRFLTEGYSLRIRTSLLLAKPFSAPQRWRLFIFLFIKDQAEFFLILLPKAIFDSRRCKPQGGDGLNECHTVVLNVYEQVDGSSLTADCSETDSRGAIGHLHSIISIFHLLIIG